MNVKKWPVRLLILSLLLASIIISCVVAYSYGYATGVVTEHSRLIAVQWGDGRYGPA